MNRLSPLILTISSAIFLVFALTCYFIFLRYEHKIRFSWKKNVVLIPLSLALIVGVPWLVSLAGNSDLVFVVGIIIAGPSFAYGLAATRVFLKKTSKERVIKQNSWKDKNVK